MKKLIFMIAFFFFATLLVAQSLVDVAKKERERRETFKGKHAKVVTNADLKTVRRIPAITTPELPPAEGVAAESEETVVPEAQEAETAFDQGGGPAFATGVLPDTTLVENPELSLSGPDGKFAEIPLYGVLILELNARNGPGDDIAVYANRTTKSLESVMPGEEDELFWNDLMTYGVLGLGPGGEWEEIGRGAGVSSPEKFDLGSLPSVSSVMIIFRYYNEPQAGFKQTKAITGDYFVGIDAVEALH